MDGFFGKFFSETVTLGVQHTFTEIAESKRHERELKVIDHQLERQEKIAAVRAGAGTSQTVKIDTTTVPLSDAGTRPPTCHLAEEDGALEMPTTEETITALKERLAKELYRFENDLQDGLRIADKPCDCAKSKHTGLIIATAEELMSYETNPLYGNIVSWVKKHQLEFTPKEISNHQPAYYQALTPEIRKFRKQLEG